MRHRWLSGFLSLWRCHTCRYSMWRICYLAKQCDHPRLQDCSGIRWLSEPLPRRNRAIHCHAAGRHRSGHQRCRHHYQDLESRFQIWSLHNLSARRCHHQHPTPSHSRRRQPLHSTLRYRTPNRPRSRHQNRRC